MEEEQVLEFDKDLLRMNLKFCHRGPEAFGSWVNHIFTSRKHAEREVRRLWPDHEGNLEEERSLQEKFAVSNLRLVLLGKSGCETSDSADLILNTNTFSKVFEQTGGLLYWRQSGEVFNRFVTVLDTHQFSQWKSQKNIRYFKKEALRADAVLLVIKGGRKQTLYVDDLKNKVETLLGEYVWRSTILLFVDGRMGNPEQRPELQELLEKVDRRYVKFSSDQVQTLLDMVEEMKRRA
ncbi:uncharacterized protein LOC114466607 [Gouania willdenowi]|uniref:uncharacterized protein LOC114466607 n=1 Tax=Gouania willdenowi TaxID=441366 RepID=UPI0010563AA7|nr:uncharacterized protein LOC114466607 [Gouania willdenowi]